MKPSGRFLSLNEDCPSKVDGQSYVWAFRSVYDDNGVVAVFLIPFDDELIAGLADVFAVDCFFNLGYSYFERNNYDLAIQNFVSVIEIAPLHVDAYMNRGMTHTFMKDNRHAIQDFNKAIEIDPDQYTYGNREFSYYSLGEYNRGRVYSRLVQYEHTIQEYNQANELDPQYPDAYYNRGLAYQQLNKNAEAEADFKKYEELIGEKP